MGGIVALMFALAAPVSAGWIGFRNDTNQPVVVQRAVVVRNRVRYSRPITLYPGEVSWDSVAQPGVKTLQVFDTRRRPLYHDNINCGRGDQFYAIRMVRPAQVQLVPLKHGCRRER